MKNKLNHPQSVDVAYAHGGLTGPYSHPMEVYEAYALGYHTYDAQVAHASEIWQSRKRENDALFHPGRSRRSRQEVVSDIEGSPRLIKVFLRNSEEYEKERGFVPKTWSRAKGGIDPKLLPQIVERAKEAGLRVTAAVNSAYGFHVAVIAGVDEISHLPGYQGIGSDEDVRIVEEDARLAGRRKIFVTLITSEYEKENRDIKIHKTEGQNVQILKKNGVPFTLGSNSYGSSPSNGAIILSTYGWFTNLELLKIWCENTAQTIYPKRKLGFLKEGYESNFIVLSRNPLKDFASIKHVIMMFKAGELFPTKQSKLHAFGTISS